MTRAISTNTPSRRNLLAGSAAALASAAVIATASAMPAGNPDAELIRLCSEFNHLTRTRTGAFDAIDDDDDRDNFLATVTARQERIKEAISSRLPTTFEGIKALGRTIGLDTPDVLDDPNQIYGGQIDGELVSTLLRALSPEDSRA